jgi:hypothetical protein
MKEVTTPGSRSLGAPAEMSALAKDNRERTRYERRWLNNRGYEGREIPSFCIFDWRVVRFIPNVAAAP